MERRDFVRASTLGAMVGMTGLGASACGSVQPRPRMASSEADELLGRLDRGLRSVRHDASVLVGNHNPRVERMVRLGLEALVVADVARSIDPEAELPDGLRDRLAEELPVLDRCTAAYGQLLEGLPMAARRNVERISRGRPDAAMEIAEWIDERASERAISHESRMRLRRIANQVKTRIRRQSISAVIDDTVGKVERIVAHKGGSIAHARQTSSNAMLASIWQSLEEGGQHQVAEAPPEATMESPEENPGDPELIVGGVMMGAGALVFGVFTIIGAVTSDLALWMAIGATPGGTLLIVGLIVLLVGVAQNS